MFLNSDIHVFRIASLRATAVALAWINTRRRWGESWEMCNGCFTLQSSHESERISLSNCGSVCMCVCVCVSGGGVLYNPSRYELVVYCEYRRM